MDTKQRSTKYLTLKEFLAQNPCVKPRTFSRWKQRGLVDFIQPGGPNTAIFVPEDALERMRLRELIGVDSGGNTRDNPSKSKEQRAVRKPDWKKQFKPKTKDSDAKE